MRQDEAGSYGRADQSDDHADQNAGVRQIWFVKESRGQSGHSHTQLRSPQAVIHSRNEGQHAVGSNMDGQVSYFEYQHR